MWKEEQETYCSGKTETDLHPQPRDICVTARGSCGGTNGNYRDIGNDFSNEMLGSLSSEFQVGSVQSVDNRELLHLAFGGIS